MERGFQCLLEGEQLAFVAARVVRLALAWCGSHEVGVDVVAIAGDVACLFDVLAPVAALLSCVEQVDTHHALFASVGVEVVACNPHLAGVLDAADEFGDILLFLLDSLHHFDRVSDMLIAAEVWPVVLMNLHLIAHGGVVAQLGFLAFADELLDVVPVATEDARVVGRRVVALARSGEAGHDGKFAFFGAHAFQAVGTGCQPQAHLEVAQGILFVEQQDFLHVILLESALPPVGVIDVLNLALAVGFLEPAVAGFLVHEAVDPVAVAAEDEHGDSEEEVLHVRGLLEREHGDGVVDHPAADVLVGGGATGVDVHQLGACPVAGEHVEELVLCHHLVGAYHVDNLVGQFVIVTPCDILAARMAGHGLDGDIVAVFVEDVGTVGGVVG